MNPGGVPRALGFKECPKARVFMISRGVIFENKKIETLLRLFVLTIGKSFLDDSKRAQISRTKLEKLLKIMTLTIGK